MYSLLLLYFFHIVNGQVADLNQCLIEVIPVQTFQPTRYEGIWYTIASYRNMFDSDYRCKVGNIKFLKESETFLANFTGFRITNNAPVNISIEGHFVDNSDTGDFIVKFTENGSSLNVPLKIVAIDYDDYAILWGCIQQQGYSDRFSWLLGRKRRLSQEILDEVLNEYSKYHLSVNDLVFMDQNNCNN